MVHCLTFALEKLLNTVATALCVTAWTGFSRILPERPPLSREYTTPRSLLRSSGVDLLYINLSLVVDVPTFCRQQFTRSWCVKSEIFLTWTSVLRAFTNELKVSSNRSWLSIGLILLKWPSLTLTKFLYSILSAVQKTVHLEMSTNDRDI